MTTIYPFGGGKLANVCEENFAALRVEKVWCQEDGDWKQISCGVCTCKYVDAGVIVNPAVMCSSGVVPFWHRKY